jgi:UDP-glucose 4-epimerase
MAVLITGGAGYIGSVFVELMQREAEDVVVLDNLGRGHRAAVDPGIPFYDGSVGDRSLVSRIIREHKVEACVHFAALAYVGESVEDPGRYFANNVGEGLVLLGTLLEAGVKRFVFSSTCATYGEARQVPISEDHPQWPTSPYGWTKLAMERALESYDRAYDLRFTALRYFNAAGATEKHGEHHDPETHLIPNVLNAAVGKLPFVSVFGSDYPTPDGTAIRDYIHVEDLCSAHILAMKHLRNGGTSQFLNLGTGRGHSVKEVIETARHVTGRPIEMRMGARRPGDPPRLIAQADKARSVLGWRPRFGDLETIVRSAWQWQEAHPNGYPESR